MSNSKNKSKKSVVKKNQSHVIPPSITSIGRRPHTDGSSTEPYQTSLLNSSDLEFAPEMEADEASLVVEDIIPLAESKRAAGVESTSHTEGIKEEVILEGQPALHSTRTKIDLKNQLEQVKGMVQMGTAIVKNSFPKPFEIAEKVVENWKEDGDFSELPIEQPLVQFYLGLGLRKAKKTEKDLETKLETAGVLPVFRQQWQKAQKLFK
jgi:hypothetical protein